MFPVSSLSFTERQNFKVSCCKVNGVWLLSAVQSAMWISEIWFFGKKYWPSEGTCSGISMYVKRILPPFVTCHPLFLQQNKNVLSGMLTWLFVYIRRGDFTVVTGTVIVCVTDELHLYLVLSFCLSVLFAAYGLACCVLLLVTPVCADFGSFHGADVEDCFFFFWDMAPRRCVVGSRRFDGR
jgi:hypothetical protein